MLSKEAYVFGLALGVGSNNIWYWQTKNTIYSWHVFWFKCYCNQIVWIWNVREEDGGAESWLSLVEHLFYAPIIRLSTPHTKSCWCGSGNLLVWKMLMEICRAERTRGNMFTYFWCSSLVNYEYWFLKGVLACCTMELFCAVILFFQVPGQCWQCF